MALSFLPQTFPREYDIVLAKSYSDLAKIPFGMPALVGKNAFGDNARAMMTTLIPPSITSSETRDFAPYTLETPAGYSIRVYPLNLDTVVAAGHKQCVTCYRYFFLATCLPANGYEPIALWCGHIYCSLCVRRRVDENRNPVAACVECSFVDTTWDASMVTPGQAKNLNPNSRPTNMTGMLGPIEAAASNVSVSQALRSPAIFGTKDNGLSASRPELVQAADSHSTIKLKGSFLEPYSERQVPDDSNESRLNIVSLSSSAAIPPSDAFANQSLPFPSWSTAITTLDTTATPALTIQNDSSNNLDQVVHSLEDIQAAETLLALKCEVRKDHHGATVDQTMTYQGGSDDGSDLSLISLPEDIKAAETLLDLKSRYSHWKPHIPGTVPRSQEDLDELDREILALAGDEDIVIAARPRK